MTEPDRQGRSRRVKFVLCALTALMLTAMAVLVRSSVVASRGLLLTPANIALLAIIVCSFVGVVAVDAATTTRTRPSRPDGESSWPW